MDSKPACSYSSTAPARVFSPLKKVQVVYYLSYRGGLLEQPHLLEVSLSTSRGLCLRDVKSRLAILRGRMMFSSFSWSYKRSYKEGFVWQDLESDDDLIFPTHAGSEYVMKGCRIESSCTLAQIPASPPKMACNPRDSVLHGISSPMMPISRVAAVLAPPIATQSANTMSLVAHDDYANKIVVGSPSNAFLHECDDNITVNLGIIEGLEQLPLAKAINPNSNYAESQASTSLNHNYHAREQNTRNTQNLQQSKEPSCSKLHLKGSIIDKQQYASPVFSVIKKVEGDCGTSASIPSLYVGADVATQTGEDDEIAEITTAHGKGKALCLPDFYHADKLQCTPESREGQSFKQRVSLQSALMIELSREEISPPPCSTSSSSTITSANSASSSNVVTCSVNPFQKLSFSQSSCLVEHQNLQDMEIIPSLRIDSDEEALLDEEVARPSCKSTLDRNLSGKKTPILSATSTENSSSDAGDHLCKNRKSMSNSFKVKPNVMSICSNSGRFLSLVSCGRGLEVIKPSDMRIQRNSSMRSILADDCGEVSGRQYSSLLNVKADENSCLDLSSPNMNSDGETAAKVKSHLPIAADDVSGRLFANAESDRAAVPSLQDGSTSNKKVVWPLRGWFHSHHKKRRSTRSKSICNNSTANENIYECLDSFEKHVVTSGTEGINHEQSSSESRHIRVGRSDHSTNTHQRSLSHDSYPRNRWVASPLETPGNRSCRLSKSSYATSIYGYDERNHPPWRSSFPVFGEDMREAKEGSSSMLQKS